VALDLDGGRLDAGRLALGLPSHSIL
jgi:hypothetical protein